MGCTLSIVSPVYNEAESVPLFLEAIRGALTPAAVDYEVILVVDPSTDGTEEVIRAASAADPRIRMVLMSRRFGQPACTIAGLAHASGEAVIVIDSDLQDPPSLIPEMVRRWQAGSLLVLAQRESRSGEPWLKRAVSAGGYSFLSRFSDVPIPPDTGDFRLMDRRVVDLVLSFPESNAFLRGIVALVGFDSDVVLFDRPPRPRGRTKYNRYLGSLRIGFNGVVGFSTALLNVSTLLGLLAAGSAFLLGLGYAVATVLGAPFPVGNPSIVVLVLFMGGLNLIALGILGLYVGRIYDETKRRPRFIVRERVGFPSASGEHQQVESSPTDLSDALTLALAEGPELPRLDLNQ